MGKFHTQVARVRELLCCSREGISDGLPGAPIVMVLNSRSACEKCSHVELCTVCSHPTVANCFSARLRLCKQIGGPENSMTSLPPAVFCREQMACWLYSSFYEAPKDSFPPPPLDTWEPSPHFNRA